MFDYYSENFIIIFKIFNYDLRMINVGGCLWLANKFFMLS